MIYLYLLITTKTLFLYHGSIQIPLSSTKKSLDDLKTFLETPVTNSLPLWWLQLGQWTKHNNSIILVLKFYKSMSIFPRNRSV